MAEKSSMTPEEKEIEKRIAARLTKRLAEQDEDAVKRGLPSSGLPAVVSTRGKVDAELTGRLSANNFIEGSKQEISPSESARGKAKKSYNVPAQITDEDRRKAAEDVARAKREMKSESDVPASDKEGLTKMLESEEGFKRGGSVRKYAMGGLVRGSVRGGGVALRGLGKGKVY